MVIHAKTCVATNVVLNILEVNKMLSYAFV